MGFHRLGLCEGVEARRALGLVCALLCVSACNYIPLDFGDECTGPSCRGGSDDATTGGDTSPGDEDADTDGDGAPDPCDGACTSTQTCVSGVCNDHPVVDLPTALTLPAGEPVSVNVAASDAEGDPLTYVWDVSACDPASGEVTAATVDFVTGPAGTCEITVTVSDGHTPVTKTVSVTLEAVVQAYVHNAPTRCLDFYDALSPVSQGTKTRPWCGLMQGLMATSYNPNLHEVFVSDLAQAPPTSLVRAGMGTDLLIVGGHPVDGALWGEPTGRTRVTLGASLSIMHTPGTTTKWKHFDFERSAACASSCTLVTVQNAAVVLDDVRVGGTDPLSHRITGPAGFYVGVHVQAGSDTDSTLLLKGGTRIEPAAEGDQAWTFGVQLTGAPGDTMSQGAKLTVEDAIILAGQATKGAVAVRSVGAKTLEFKTYAQIEAVSSAPTVFGLLDGLRNVAMVDGEPTCATSATCEGALDVLFSGGSVDVTSSYSSPGAPNATGVALFGTTKATFLGTVVHARSALRVRGLWTQQVGASATVGADPQLTIDGASIDATLYRYASLMGETSVIAFEDGEHNPAVFDPYRHGSQRVSITGGAFTTKLDGDPGPSAAIVSAIALRGTEGATISQTELVVGASLDGHVVDGVAAFWSASTRQVTVDEVVAHAADSQGLVPIRAMQAVVAFVDGATEGGTSSGAPVHGSVDLTVSSSHFDLELDAASSTTQVVCAMALGTQNLVFTDNDVRCPAGGNTAWSSHMRTRGLGAATITGNRLVVTHGANDLIRVAGFHDGEVVLDEATGGATALTFAGNRIELQHAQNANETAAIGLWLEDTTLAAPLSNNAVLVDNFKRVTGMALRGVSSGPAGYPIAANTVRVASTGATGSQVVGVWVTEDDNSSGLKLVDGIIATESRTTDQATYALVESFGTHMSSSALKQVGPMLFVGTTGLIPTYYQKVATAEPSTSVSAVTGTCTWQYVDEPGCPLGTADNNPAPLFSASSPFCHGAWNAFHLAPNASEAQDKVLGTPSVDADIDGEARGSNYSDLGADEFTGDGLCLCDGALCP